MNLIKTLTTLTVALLIVATNAMAQPYDLYYNVFTGELQMYITGNIVNYEIVSSDGIFLEDESLEQTNHNLFVSYFYFNDVPILRNGTSTSTPHVLSETNYGYNGATQGYFSLGNVLPAGWSYQEVEYYLGNLDATYVTHISSPRVHFNIVYAPEPSSLVLLSLCGLLIAKRRRMR